MNPFEKPSAKINMAQYIRDCFVGKKSGDSFELDMKGVDVSDFRPAMFDALKKTGIKFKTKSANGKLWVYVI